jgi:uncharacterized Zn ribbon protein
MTHSTVTLLAKIGGLAAVFALSLGILVGAGVAAHAQEDGDQEGAVLDTYSAHGTGLNAGDEVVAFVDLTECGTTTADQAGDWFIFIPNAADCDPAAGATITFTLNGADANETAVFAAGGVVTDDGYDFNDGIVLTVDSDGAAATATPDAQDGITNAYSAHGTGLVEGDEVVAFVDLTECGTSSAEPDSTWAISLPDVDDCDPADGAIITFTLNGELANETAVFVAGGDVSDDGYDAVEGIVLTVDGDGAAATATPSDTSTPPPAGSTGNAGLTSVSGSGAALLLLGLLAGSLAAGARIATRSR